MEQATVKEHPKYPDWVTITQVDNYCQAVDDIHIRMSEIPNLIEKLKAFLPKVSQ